MQRLSLVLVLVGLAACGSSNANQQAAAIDVGDACELIKDMTPNDLRREYPNCSAGKDDALLQEVIDMCRELAAN